MKVQVYAPEQIRELERFYYELSASRKRSIILSAFRRSTRPLIQAARANAPKRTGKLAKHIKAKPVRRKIALDVGAYAPHSHLIERGTKERVRKSGGSTGRVQPRKFFERAYIATEPIMVKSVEQNWYNAIDRFIVRAKKRLAKARQMDALKR